MKDIFGQDRVAVTVLFDYHLVDEIPCWQMDHKLMDEILASTLSVMADHL